MTTAADLACPACGAAVVDGDRFCEACGAELAEAATTPYPTTPYPITPSPVTPPDAATCPACGTRRVPGSDGYCGECGLRLPAPRDHTEIELDGLAAVSDRGKVHHRNEDAYAVAAGAEVTAVVCDGVSSTMNPHLASAAAASAALEALAVDGGEAAQRLVAAFSAARNAVNAVESDGTETEAGSEAQVGSPSCTFLAAVIKHDVVDLATLGDCRSYWLPSDGPPAVLTQDHSWAAQQVASGAMTAAEAYSAPEAHAITRWLGRDGDASWRPQLVQFAAQTPGRLVLCSDGLWNYAETPDALALAAAGDGTAIDVARRLTEFANANGGHDNITVVVVDLPHEGSKGVSP